PCRQTLQGWRMPQSPAFGREAECRSANARAREGPCGGTAKRTSGRRFLRPGRREDSRFRLLCVPGDRCVDVTIRSPDGTELAFFQKTGSLELLRNGRKES